MNSLAEIKKKIGENKHILKETYNVRQIGIFGSYTKGNPDRKSDIDILVEFAKPVNFFEFLRTEYFLSDLLGIKVDLVTKKALKPLIKNDILEQTVYV